MDFGDVASLQTAFAGVHTLYLLLPLAPNKLALAQNAIPAARAAGVKHIVRSSGAGADPAAGFALPRLRGEIENPAAHAGKAHTLTGGAAISNEEAVKAIGDAIGKAVSDVAVPDAAAIASMQGMGMDDWSIDEMMSLTQLTAAGHAAGTTDTVRQLIGREPTGFAHFVADHKSAWV